MGFSLDELNWGMAEAAFFGHLDIVCLMLFIGANNYNTGLMTAASKGHLGSCYCSRKVVMILMEQWPWQIIEVMNILLG